MSIDIIKVKIEVKVLNIELISNKGIELRVKIRLSNNIKNIDIWALITLRSK